MIKVQILPFILQVIEQISICHIWQDNGWPLGYTSTYSHEGQDVRVAQIMHLFDFRDHALDTGECQDPYRDIKSYFIIII